MARFSANHLKQEIRTSKLVSDDTSDIVEPSAYLPSITGPCSSLLLHKSSLLRVPGTSLVFIDVSFTAYINASGSIISLTLPPGNEASPKGNLSNIRCTALDITSGAMTELVQNVPYKGCASSGITPPAAITFKGVLAEGATYTFMISGFYNRLISG